MIDCFIPNMGNLQFNPNDVPTFYQWSGYTHDIEEYKKYNFLSTEIKGTTVLICSAVNGVALCEYLSRYIINSDFLFKTEDRFSPDFHYWFFRAWEQTEQDFVDQGWFIKIVQLFMDRNMIIRIPGEDSDFFCLIGFEQYETKALPEEMLIKIREICNETLKEYELLSSSYEDDD